MHYQRALGARYVRVMAQRTKTLARNHKTALRSFSIEVAPPNLRPSRNRAASIFVVATTPTRLNYKTQIQIMSGKTT